MPEDLTAAVQRRVGRGAFSQYVTEAVAKQLELDLLAELRGGPRDAPLHRVLSRVGVLPVTAELGRRAGELLGAAGLSGHRCAIDAIDAVVAAPALGLPRPVVVLTSDPDDLNQLVDEQTAPRTHGSRTHGSWSSTCERPRVTLQV